MISKLQEQFAFSEQRPHYFTIWFLGFKPAVAGECRWLTSRGLLGRSPARSVVTVMGIYLRRSIKNEPVGGFKHFLYFHPYLPGKMIQLGPKIFFQWVGSTTNSWNLQRYIPIPTSEAMAGMHRLTFGYIFWRFSRSKLLLFRWLHFCFNKKASTRGAVTCHIQIFFVDPVRPEFGATFERIPGGEWAWLAWLFGLQFLGKAGKIVGATSTTLVSRWKLINSWEGTTKSGLFYKCFFLVHVENWSVQRPIFEIHKKPRIWCHQFRTCFSLVTPTLSQKIVLESCWKPNVSWRRQLVFNCGNTVILFFATRWFVHRPGSWTKNDKHFLWNFFCREITHYDQNVCFQTFSRSGDAQKG